MDDPWGQLRGYTNSLSRPEARSKKKQRIPKVPKKVADHLAVACLILGLLLIISAVRLPEVAQEDRYFNPAQEKSEADLERYEAWKDSQKVTGNPTYSYEDFDMIARAPSGWEDEVILSDNSASTFSVDRPDVAANGDRVHVVWQEQLAPSGDYGIFYRNSSDGGDTWSGITNISIYNQWTADWPFIEVWGETLHVVWMEVIPFFSEEIFYARSDDGGIHWTTPMMISNSDGNTQSDWPCLAVNGSNVHVVWTDFKDGIEEIYYNSSYDNGVTWNGHVRLTNIPAQSLNPVIGANGDNIHVSWYDDFNGAEEIYYINSTDNGQTWSTYQRLTNIGFDSQAPQIAVIGSNVHVVWEDIRHGNWEIYYINSSDGGISWANEQRLTNDVAWSYYPAISANASTVSVVWYDSRNDLGDIYFKNSTDNGITWSSDIRITLNSEGSSWPRIATGSFHVVFSDDRTGTEEVYYKRSTPFDPPVIPEFENLVIPCVFSLAIITIIRRKRKK